MKIKFRIKKRKPLTIIEVMSPYVRLVKDVKRHVLKRKNIYVGECPWCKKPSLIVYAKNEVYKCHNPDCNKGGNKYNFLMHYKGMSYNEALLQIDHNSKPEE